ncbi:MAG: sugar transferase [Candidatus Tyrphobacter sp.]
MQIAISTDVDRRTPRWWWSAKRVTDLVLGCSLFALSLPLVALAALAIVLCEGGSPFYAQTRVGQNGRAFKMYKLRTMIEGAHEMRDEVAHLNEADGPAFKIADDPRCHPLGRMLRRTSIDELPNFVNVIRGDMALVGPRPALPCEVECFDARAMRRLEVPQGVTGLWQISGRSDLPFSQWTALDNRYVDEWTPLRDLAIIAKTIPAVVRKDGAR